MRELSGGHRSDALYQGKTLQLAETLIPEGYDLQVVLKCLAMNQALAAEGRTQHSKGASLVETATA
jgi:hypothetical protein